MYPRIYLTIDNCFASKRWTTPDEWSKVISEIGVQYIEGSADTELDPLFMGREYLKDWADAARRAETDHGVKIANLFSGHGTYSTLGLAHTDKRVRRRMMDHWFKPLIETAVELNAGVGFYAHAFSNSVLMDATTYAEYYAILADELAELNQFAHGLGCKYLALEQMYTPHQIPWTISGTTKLLNDVSKASGLPFYFTEDVGHHSKKFLMPTLEEVAAGEKKKLWLGNPKAYERFNMLRRKEAVSPTEWEAVREAMEETPYLFAQEADGDCYAWLSQLGCYSPIIHLQQTDGNSSPHGAFTPQGNLRGIIHGDRVLRAIKDSYDSGLCMENTPKCSEIYLTLELFFGTSQTTQEIVENYKTTVQYWRQFIPQDGMTLDALVGRLT